MSREFEENQYQCKCCNKTYCNEYYDFHRLCHECFKTFDEQKMKGRCKIICQRFGLTEEITEDPEPEFYTESVDEFIKQSLCIHYRTTLGV